MYIPTMLIFSPQSVTSWNTSGVLSFGLSLPHRCISRMLLGTTYATGKSALPRIIPQYTQLFLYNMDEQHLYAVFEATEPG